MNLSLAAGSNRSNSPESLMLRILAAIALVVCTAGLGFRAALADPPHAAPADATANPVRAAAADPAHAVPADQSADPRAALLKRLPAGSQLEHFRASDRKDTS